jgi:pimeloyl-ACP methyl ester carboxylesterase
MNIIIRNEETVGSQIIFFFFQTTFFSSIDKVPKVMSPTLVIHGTEDEVIDFSHGLTIFEKCPRAVEPLWVEVILQIIRLASSLTHLQKSSNTVENME